MSTYYAEKFYTTGKRVRARLTALGMTQTELYDDMRRRGAKKVSKSFISQVANDVKGISIDNLVPMAQALETTTDHLLLIRDDPEPYSEREAQYFSEEAERVAKLVDEMQPALRATILQVASAVADIGDWQAKVERDRLLGVVEKVIGRDARQAVEASLTNNGSRDAR